MRFCISGHHNVLSEHRTTLEFTKDEHLTLRGDCILGIRATFKEPKSTAGRLRVEIGCDGINDRFVGYGNPDFSNINCMVIRKSSFLDARTFLVRSNKAACDIDRRIVEILKDENARAKVIVSRQKTKAIIFDLDNTLEIWSEPQRMTLQMMCDLVAERYNISAIRFKEEFERARSSLEAKSPDPKDYGRDVWMTMAFKALSMRVPYDEIKQLEREYWRFCESLVRLYPGVEKMLKRIRLKKAVLTDADGDKIIKMRRIRNLGVDKLVDVIVTSNDIGANKPDVRNFLMTAKLLKVEPEECVMVGDRPQTDLITAKKLGMVTVLVKQSAWQHPANYIDFEIDDIIQLPSILKLL
jgi:uncharacterized protein